MQTARFSELRIQILMGEFGERIAQLSTVCVYKKLLHLMCGNVTIHVWNLDERKF